MDLSNQLIRCSSIGKVMTNGRGSNTMGATCTTYLKELYLEMKYSRRRDFSSKEIEKGKRMEEDALTLLSLVKKYPFKKNTERLRNDYLTGEPDAFIGGTITEAEEGFDTKCPWSLWTFPFDVAPDKLDKMYYWQNMGYMALTGAKRWTTAYCLVNAPSELIKAEKMKVWYALGCPDEESSEYQERAREVEKNMIFDREQFNRDNPAFDFDIPESEWIYDIPREERLKEFPVERDEDAIGAIYTRIEECREYMNQTFNP